MCIKEASYVERERGRTGRERERDFHYSQNITKLSKYSLCISRNEREREKWNFCGYSAMHCTQPVLPVDAAMALCTVQLPRWRSLSRTTTVLCPGPAQPAGRRRKCPRLGWAVQLVQSRTLVLSWRGTVEDGGLAGVGAAMDSAYCGGAPGCCSRRRACCCGGS